MSHLGATFAQLPPSGLRSGNSLLFETVRVQTDLPHRISRNQQGHPCLLISVAQGGNVLPAPMQLEHLTVQHGLTGVCREEAGSFAFNFSFVELRSAEPVLVEVFLDFCRDISIALGANPTAKQIALQIRHLADLLQCLRAPGIRTVQGLWAELFVISQMTNAEKWVEGWHVDPMQLHDFVFQGSRIEVKSSSGRERLHKFSHDQLHFLHGSAFWLASILVDRSSSGDSVFDLAMNVKARIDAKSAMKLDAVLLKTLGEGYLSARDVKFDSSGAAASLRFYARSEIPSLPDLIPDSVFDVTYAVLLDEDLGTKSPPPV